MDNINPPSNGNAPQGGQPPEGDQQQGSGSPDQNNSADSGQPSPDAGQDQGQGQADSLKMPPDVSAGGEGGGPPDVQSPDQGGPPSPPGEIPEQPQAEGASTDQGLAPSNQGGQEEQQGPVEDVLEGAEGQTADQGAVPQEAAPEQGPSPGAEGQLPAEAPQGDLAPPPGPEASQEMPPGEPPQGEAAPQSQPDFTVPPQEVPGQAQPPQAGGSKVLPILLIIVLLLIAGVALAYFMNWISLPFLDSLLGREQPTEEVAPAEGTAEVTPYPEDTQRKNDLQQIKAALEKYFEDSQKYPVAKVLENSSKTTSTIYQALAPNYLETMPTDPASPSKYYGYQSADGTSFELSAVLDNPDDTEGVKRGNLMLYILTNVSEVESSQPAEAT